ncbi:ABC transporter substrate-binding protein [Microbacterium gilvum]|uniref:ABC transporter substrate-binding protein n=1 Tax=Microbacterium gilvum TaxID=1336204 RepID=A0ABP9AB32_9MICO
MSLRSPRRLLVGATLAGASALVLAGCSGGSSSDDGSEISILIDNAETTVATMEALVAAFEEAHPDIHVDIETRPQGTEGDNIVKTRLSTGEMTDLFAYNTGSLLQALNPDQMLVDLGDEEWVSTLQDSFTPVVSTDEGFYGAPLGQTSSGAIFYNKTVYAELGLEVPTTWDEFVANAEAVKAQAPDVAPIIQSYGETWTSQVLVLGDFANVMAADPDWADAYTANEAKYVDDPAFAGFRHLEELNAAGLFNEDYASTTYDEALAMLADGEGAHYPILSWAIQNIAANNPDAVDDIGLFAIPGESAADNALTVWQPGAVYVPTSTEGARLESAKTFLAWLTTPESCAVQVEATGVPYGPFVIDGCELGDDVPSVVTDEVAYFDAGTVQNALEFLSPIKGPSLEQITVAVGSGITPAAEGAQQYDDDVTKQAQQLGIEGW